jgi:CO/xanthine dehydrogenase FAD-binding subunit
MKPAPFSYYDPATTDDAVALLGEYGLDSKVLAGGQSLVPLLNMRLARPGVLIDINRIAGLDTIELADGGLTIGATVRQRRLQDNPLIAEQLPMLRELASWIGHPQIRSRGTIVGSIAHADPAGELPAAALLLDAELTAVSPRGSRQLLADDLYLGYLSTTLEVDEFITHVYFPALPPSAGWSIQEIARRAGDFALAGILAAVVLEDDEFLDARVAAFGVGARPVRLTELEGNLLGRSPSETLFADAGTQALELVEPDSDVHATADYRRAAVGTLTKRALREAVARAQGGVA